MDQAHLLSKWRHLIEPEITRGLTPCSWEMLLTMNVTVFEASHSVVLVRDIQINGRLMRSIWVAAGQMNEVLQLVNQVEQSARRDGIGALVFIGRRGWIRAIPGYKEMATVGLKEL